MYCSEVVATISPCTCKFNSSLYSLPDIKSPNQLLHNSILCTRVLNTMHVKDQYTFCAEDVRSYALYEEGARQGPRNMLRKSKILQYSAWLLPLGFIWCCQAVRRTLVWEGCRLHVLSARGCFMCRADGRHREVCVQNECAWAICQCIRGTSLPQCQSIN